jgi:hypothetical protein
MRSYLLKASDEDMDRWRAAAKERGLSLAGFLRSAADEAVPRPSVLGERMLVPLVPRSDSFRPDFKK